MKVWLKHLLILLSSCCVIAVGIVTNCSFLWDLGLGGVIGVIIGFFYFGCTTWRKYDKEKGLTYWDTLLDR